MQIAHAKEKLHFEEMNKLTEAVGWGENYYPSKAIWQRVLDHSYVAYIEKNGQLIAFGRLVEDGLMCMFYDICVHPDFQKTTLGTQIMESLLAHVQQSDYVCKGLFVWQGNPGAKHFYQSLGFKEAVAMEL